MGQDDDGLRGASWDNCDQVDDLALAETGDLGLETPGGAPSARSLRAAPSPIWLASAAPGEPGVRLGLSPGEFARELDRARFVERGVELRFGQRVWAADGESGNEERHHDAGKAGPVDPARHRALEGSAPRSPASFSHVAGHEPLAVYARVRPYPVAVATPASILVVDDEESIQKLLTYPLEREGFHVVQARDGEEALERFDGGEFDLVVLDLALPKLDGLEVCRRLRSPEHRPDHHAHRPRR